MVNDDRSDTAPPPRSQDLSQDFDFGPEEQVWDEEDGLFDSEEIVVG
ncbi:hypothetical protein [Sinomonas soli]